ncbi:hypothetical protein Pcinc_025175 [Petrolisthes cinctipes]|uniref:FK506-binding protein 15-like domain-containing protein n=1 Tax=Petrolisthes cinctipes TaxID=88211 RepID=A0AAE1F8J9_PETCI|nr:hypothetical protein Pcinc_025175 [Petrolisthes cinctipes]
MFLRGAEDDDDDDFNPASSGSSKLSALFGGSPRSKSSNSLKYVAPKQPRGDHVDSSGTPTPGEQVAGNKLASVVLIAVPVQAYLYMNQVPQSQGQAMCCVLGDVAAANFQLLLYRSKQDHLTRARITQHFSISVQANHYATFMDDQQRSWSIMLESGQYVDILTQIGICRALVESSSNKSVGSVVVVQDLGLGEGPGIKEGDQAQLSITTNIVTSAGKKGEQVEEKADQRVKIKDQDSNWMRGLLGGQKNTRRLVFTHRSKDGSGGLVVHDVTVSRVRQKAGGGSGGEQSGRSTPQVETTPPQLPTATSVRDNTPISSTSEVLLEEPLAEPQSRPTPSSRAHLMSRMARVGRQLLPSQKAHSVPHPHPTDSESEVEEISRTKGRGRLSASEGSTEELAATPAMSHPIPSPRPLHPHHPHPHQQMVVYQSAFRPHPSALPGEYVSATVAPQPAPSVAPPAPDPTLSLLFSETRSQNTDVKISVARMSDKIDTLVSKIEKLEQQQQHQMAVTGQTGMNVGIGGMMMPQYPNPALILATTQTDPQALLSQVMAIVKENESMKAKLEEREAKVAALNDSLTQLLHKNQKLLEDKTSMLEAKEAGAGARSEVTELREERAKLAGQVSLTSHQLDTLRNELSQSKERIQDKDREVEQLKTKIEAQFASSQDDHTVREALLNEKNLLQEKLENALRESEEVRREKEESRKESEDAKRERDEIVREMKEVKKQLELVEEKQVTEEMQADLKREVEVTQAENEGLKKKVEDLEQQMEVKRQQLKEVTDQKIEAAPPGLVNTHQMDTAKLKQLENEVAALTARCSQLEEEKLETSRHLFEQLKSASSEKSQLEAKLAAAERQHSATTTSNNTENMVGMVKRVMNTVYRVLKPQFLPNQTYGGEEVIQSLLVVIRDTTLNMMEELEKNNIVEDSKKSAGLAKDMEKTDQTADKEGSVRREEEVSSGSLENTSKARVKTGEAMAESTVGGTEPDNVVGDSSKSQDNSDSCEGDSAVTTPTITECSPQHTFSNAGHNRHDSQGDSTILSAGRDLDEEPKEKLDVKSGENKDVGEVTNVQTVVEDIMKKKPVIDLSNTGSTTTCGRSDSSRDSSLERGWRPQPPTPPLFSDEDEDDCDWLS